MHMLAAAPDTSETVPEQITLTATQRSDYLRDGFLVLPSIGSEFEISWVRQLYDGFFSEKRGWDTGDFFETAGDVAGTPASLPQMNWLSRYEPKLCQSSLHRVAHSIACELLGPTAELVWEFAMMKPPLVGGATPAHQDQAFFTKETDYSNAISIWIPLQDVDRQNGCMEYVPGSHLGPLHPHQSINGDPRAHGLEVVLAPRPVFTAVPLSVGDAVVHHSRVLHCSGPNLSAAPRRAYILEFAVRSKKELQLQDYAWNRSKRTARDERQQRSMTASERMTTHLRWLKRRIERMFSSFGQDPGS